MLSVHCLRFILISLTLSHISTSSLRANEEDHAVFESKDCADVRRRASMIVSGRMGGLTWQSAWRHLRHSELDGRMIIAAYELSRFYQTNSEMFSRQDEFVEHWVSRCIAAVE